ncbi:MAG: outer membrane beta-barrel protein [Verrucomicrobiales bacterium]
MKGISVFFAISFVLCSVSQADWRWDKQRREAPKSPMVEQRITSPSHCFDTGFVISGFASGFLPDDSRLDDSVGGGASLAYFFGHNWGVELSYALNGSAPNAQVGTGNLVYRLPLGGECCANVAPYVFGGPGVASAGHTEFLWNVGGGIDIRSEAWGCMGIFADVSYNWVDDNISDFTLVRGGIKIPF